MMMEYLQTHVYVAGLLGVRRSLAVDTCSEAGVRLFDRAAATDAVEQTIAVFDAVDQMSAAIPVDLRGKSWTDLATHKKIRYHLYARLQKKYGYMGYGERVPLPLLAETIVKALFPGNEAFVGFVGGGFNALWAYFPDVFDEFFDG